MAHGDELEESGKSAVTQFTYNFKDDLKIKRQDESAESDLDRSEVQSIGSIDINGDISQSNFENIKSSLMKNSSQKNEDRQITFIEQTQIEEIRKDVLSKKQASDDKSYIQKKLVEKDKKI